MEADVQRAIIAVKGPTAAPLPPCDGKRHLQFERCMEDSSRKMKRIDWEIDGLVRYGDGRLTICECKHSVTPSHVDDFVEMVRLLTQAVRRRAVFTYNKPYQELMDAWPKDPMKLELVLAAPHGWDVPHARHDGKTPREKARMAGVKIIEHNGALWDYSA
jgi:hypothetical protein